MTTFERNYLIISLINLIVHLSTLAIQLNPNHASSLIENQLSPQVPLTETYQSSD